MNLEDSKDVWEGDYVTTTVFELLKLVRYGKAPIKIRYNELTYTFNETQSDYECFLVNHYEFLLDNINTFEQLSDKVEIVENNNTIKKIDVNKLQTIKKCNRAKVLGNKINEIIDILNKMVEKW